MLCLRAREELSNDFHKASVTRFSHTKIRKYFLRVKLAEICQKYFTCLKLQGNYHPEYA